MDPEEIRVNDVLEELYREHGYVTIKDKGDTDSRYYLEQEARKRALAHLDPEDRKMIEACAAALKISMSGNYAGKGTVLQIIEHIGIFLAASSKRMNKR